MERVKNRNFSRGIPIALYASLNLLMILIVNRVSDLPVWVKNWETKALQIASLQLPTDNFYPPGSAILLVPFLWNKPNYTLAIFFYFTSASVMYYLICKSLRLNKGLHYIALAAFTFNPYLLWLVNSSQDTVFELFLLLSGFALIQRKSIILSLFPLYLLCLTRPAYWVFLLLLPLAVELVINQKKIRIRTFGKLISLPMLFLVTTFALNQLTFGTPSLARESGLTAHFSHNKFYYLSMPKFDMDVFLSTGGNMDLNEKILSDPRFSKVKDPHLKTALVSIANNPKSFALNTLQKVDSYFFAIQKTPQLPGEYYLSRDQKEIVIGDERLSWMLILGNITYFFYRAFLVIFFIAALTILCIKKDLRIKMKHQGTLIFALPFVCGAIPGVMFYTESRFKIVSELLLVPLIVKVFTEYRSSSNSHPL